MSYSEGVGRRVAIGRHYHTTENSQGRLGISRSIGYAALDERGQQEAGDMADMLWDQVIYRSDEAGYDTAVNRMLVYTTESRHCRISGNMLVHMLHDIAIAKHLGGLAIEHRIVAGMQGIRMGPGLQGELAERIATIDPEFICQREQWERGERMYPPSTHGECIPGFLSRVWSAWEYVCNNSRGAPFALLVPTSVAILLPNMLSAQRGGAEKPDKLQKIPYVEVKTGWVEVLEFHPGEAAPSSLTGGYRSANECCNILEQLGKAARLRVMPPDLFPP